MTHLRPQVLYLVHRIPHPPNRGDRIRSFHILDFLSKRADVHLATLAEEPVSNETMQVLRDRCVNVAVERVGKTRWLRGALSLSRGRSATEGLFRSPKLCAQIQSWSREINFDAVLVFCSSMGQYLALPELHDVPAIVDFVDVDSEKFFQYSRSSTPFRRILYWLEASRVRKLEKSLTKRCGSVVLVSEAEANLWRGICPNDHTCSVRQGVDIDYFLPSGTQGRPARCLFVGALDYPPNVDGVCWFARDVWPEVRRHVPQATFAIVGRNPRSQVRQLNEIAGIEVIGSVNDVRPHLSEAMIVVAPLRIARGIQNKVLEAMAAGRPVIASPAAVEGLDVIPDKQLRVADKPLEWVQKISELVNEPPQRSALAAQGRKFVETYHDWNTCLSPYLDLLLPTKNRHEIGHIPSYRYSASYSQGAQ